MKNKNAPAATEASSKTELCVDSISQLPTNLHSTLDQAKRWVLSPCSQMGSIAKHEGCNKATSQLLNSRYYMDVRNQPARMEQELERVMESNFDLFLVWHRGKEEHNE